MSVQDDGEPATPQEQDQEHQPPQRPDQFRLRRAPKYYSFGLTGVVIGVVIGLILAFSSPATGDYSQNTIAGYFAAIGALIGALIGLGVAVWADRKSTGRR